MYSLFRVGAGTARTRTRTRTHGQTQTGTDKHRRARTPRAVDPQPLRPADYFSQLVSQSVGDTLSQIHHRRPSGSKIWEYWEHCEYWDLCEPDGNRCPFQKFHGNPVFCRHRGSLAPVLPVLPVLSCTVSRWRLHPPERYRWGSPYLDCFFPH